MSSVIDPGVPQGEFRHPIFITPDGMLPLEKRRAVAETLRKALNGEFGLGIYDRDKTGEIMKTVTNNLGVNTTMALAGIPLMVPAKMLYTVVSPLRNKFPRFVRGGLNFSYRQVTGINTKRVWPSVPEASGSVTGRNTRLSYNAEPLTTVNFKSLEMETILTREALFGGSSTLTPGQDFAPQEFATLSLLQAMFMAEEDVIIGGNSADLGNVAGVAKASTQQATTVGGLTASTTYYIYVTPLTLQGLRSGAASGDGTQAKGQAGTGSDSTGEGTGAEFALATTAGGNAGDEAIDITWTDVPGAFAYNCYIGATTGIANAKYAGTAYTNSYSFQVAPGSLTGGRPNAADTTGNAYDFDGLVKLCATAYAGSYPPYFSNLNGAALTGDNTTGVAELDAANLYAFQNYKTGPSEWWTDPATKLKIDKIILGSSAPYWRLEAAQGDTRVTGGLSAGFQMNRYTGVKQPIYTHPNLPSGMIIGICEDLGPYYPNSNVGANVEMDLAWDYLKTDYSRDRRADQPGIDMSGALVTFAPFAHAILKGVG